MSKFFLVPFLLLCSVNVNAQEQTQPTSKGALTVPENEPLSHSELALILGNETNPVDGPFGPFTYGLRGNHTFENKTALQAGYVLLHEPHTPQFNAVLDEGQLTFKLPETTILSQSVIVAATAWSNRIIDMYTNLGGLEFTRSDAINVSFGLYLGSAKREDAVGIFKGTQLTVTGTIEPVDISAACMVGTINTGSFRHAAVEFSHGFLSDRKIPMTFTFAIEDRYFDFGNGGPSSEPQDEFIFVTGIEVHFEKLIL